MREHEVPTHVQAEDRVLLWFTFPQVVALTAVCALSYGAYRYAPVGPAEVRTALAVVLGLGGVAAVVGRIGGRRLPLVAADLLRFWLGARRYAGSPAQLVRSQPPPPVQTGPGPLRLMARRVGRGLRRLRRRSRERRNGRMPLGRHGWFDKRRRRRQGERARGGDHRAEGLGTGRRRARRSWLPSLALAALAVAAAAAPQAVLADGHAPEGGWRDEIGFEPSEPVPGRRLFVEELSVAGDRAEVTLRAATDLDLRVRAYGGRQGSELRFWGSARLAEGERIDYSLPLSGESPSLTFSWEDALGQAGAVSLRDEQIPYPLPSVEGELCDLSIVSLGWTPGAIEGAVESDCATAVEEAVELQSVAGHESVTGTSLMEASVIGITGTVTVSAGGAHTSVPFVPGGETRFRIAVPTTEAVHEVEFEASLEASLRIDVPPLVRLTHVPERTERRTERVSLVSPGTSKRVYETVSVTHGDGTTTHHTISARLSIPSRTVHRDVTITILHPERVVAEVVQRQPIDRSRGETLTLAASVSSDAPFSILALPEPEPEDEPAEQTPLTDEELRDLLGLFGRRPWS